MRYDDLKKTLPPLLYFSVNALFVCKYGARTAMGAYLPILAYAGLFAAALLIYPKFIAPKIEALKPRNFAYIYFGLLALFAVAALALLFRIDPYLTEVDRWSGLHNFIQYMFAGKFPYAAPSHLGSQISPLPIMNFIAIPFYLLGDVGYLQIFTFTAMAMIVFFSRAPNSVKLLFMLAFLSSPAFWYEVAVRSDLVSNMLIMCMGLLLIGKLTRGYPLNRPVAAGCVCGLLFCTRGIFIIPFTVFCFEKVIADIKKSGLIRSFYFAAMILITFAGLLMPFILWDVDLFAQNNPFSMQTNKSPFAVVLSAMIIAALLSFRTRDMGGAFTHTASCLFALMGASLAVRALTLGWDAAIFQHKFDITYYSTIMPYLIMGMVYGAAKDSRSSNRHINADKE